MNPLYKIIFMGILPFTLISCEKPDFDKLVCETYNSSIAPEYRQRYIIEVSVDKITYTSISATDKKTSETKKITASDFEQIKNKVYELGVIKCNSSQECDGGGTFSATGYKKGKEIFTNTHFGCNDDCSGFYQLLRFLNNYTNN